MIYGNIIREQQYQKMSDNIIIIQEYYENEISFLKSVIEYQNKSSMVTESTDLEILHEGFIENIMKKIKEIIRNLKEWFKKFFNIHESRSKKYDQEIKDINKGCEEALDKLKKKAKENQEKYGSPQRREEEYEKNKNKQKELDEREKERKQRLKDLENTDIEIIYYNVYGTNFYTKYLHSRKIYYNIYDEILVDISDYDTDNFEKPINNLTQSNQEILDSNAEDILKEYETVKTVKVNKLKDIIDDLDKSIKEYHIGMTKYIREVNKGLDRFEKLLSSLEPNEWRNQEWYQQFSKMTNLVQSSSRAAVVLDEQLLSKLRSSLKTINKQYMDEYLSKI